MSAVSADRPAAPRGRTALGAFLASRIVVLAAGITGALALPRLPGWWAFDPTRLTARLGALGNVLAAPAVRWDSIHYLAIAEHGYRKASDAVFFPLYPLLVHALGLLVGSDVVAAVVVSASSFAVALVLLHCLTELELGSRAADACVLLLAFAPVSFFFTAIYTESLVLALSVGSLYAARRGWMVRSSLLAALAALTRVTGVLLAIPLAILHLRDRRRPQRATAWLALVPGALLAYLGYCAALGFGPLAPYTQQAMSDHGHGGGGPLATLAGAVQHAASGLGSILIHGGAVYGSHLGSGLSYGARSVLLLAVLMAAALALRATWRRLPAAYGAYAAAALLACVWSPVSEQPLLSLDRYTLTIFPLWMAAGAWLSERRLTWPAVATCAPLLALWTLQFAVWTFVA